MRLPIIAAMAVLLHALPPLAGAAEGAGSTETVLVRTDLAAPVAPKQLDRVLARSSVFARLPANATLRFPGPSLVSETDSAVFLGASADLVFAACLKGEIRAGDERAEPGQVIVWRPGGAAPDSLDFDVKRFLATSSVALDPETQAALDALLAHQKRLIFWGVLARGTVNLQSLTAPLLEPTRRAYLRRPTIIDLRLKHKTMGALAGAIAQTFVEALVEGDGETIADLLNPSLFVPKGGGIASSDWQRTRRAFASRIAGQKWRGRLEPTVAPTGVSNVWYGE